LLLQSSLHFVHTTRCHFKPMLRVPSASFISLSLARFFSRRLSKLSLSDVTRGTRAELGSYPMNRSRGRRIFIPK
jgi:hypothetical protein